MKNSVSHLRLLILLTINDKNNAINTSQQFYVAAILTPQFKNPGSREHWEIFWRTQVAD